MTREKQREAFELQQDRILEGIPEVLWSTFKRIAWREGHSAGYSEVLSYLEEYVEDFREPLKELLKQR